MTHRACFSSQMDLLVRAALEQLTGIYLHTEMTIEQPSRRYIGSPAHPPCSHDGRWEIGGVDTMCILQTLTWMSWKASRVTRFPFRLQCSTWIGTWEAGLATRGTRSCFLTRPVS